MVKVCIFDNYNFNIPQRSISMYPNESGTITYDLNGNKNIFLWMREIVRV